MAETSDTRTPAQIEADIKRRREVLAETLDEIGVRVHPKTIVGDAKAKAVANLDHVFGQAFVTANRVMTEVRDQFVDDDGAPRMERIVPAALIVAGAVGLVVVGATRRRRR
ncbi:DUF3618 domain-containing protein [Streptomyces sp. NPDC004549]|uniref:DUF3618 domain-containing protein n=1 Tax=unclassified Streptomyces TaxID=2593676 RepID=UPI0018F42F8C|nr:DUF3618 domain-containing protein [Streptomyces sp. DSM 110735]MBJ7905168.1 DUF3618 domain-containing protein [Streptomyces sp. DSM 110735]